MLSIIGGKAQRFLCGGVLIAAMAFAAPVHADTVQPTDVLPVPRYGTDPMSVDYAVGGGHTITSMKLTLTDASNDQVAPPVFPIPVVSFFDVFAEITIDGNVYTATGLGGVQIDATLTPGVFNTELISLDISGGTLPAGFQLQESPSDASTGTTTETPAGGGYFHIDSFFDVFTELSIDGGTSWTPGSSPMHVTAIPEPTALATMGLGLLALVRRRRR